MYITAGKQCRGKVLHKLRRGKKTDHDGGTLFYRIVECGGKTHSGTYWFNVYSVIHMYDVFLLNIQFDLGNDHTSYHAHVKELYQNRSA
jgi:hypothetical protein